MRRSSIIISFVSLLGSSTAFADKDFVEVSEGTTWDCASDPKVNISYGDATFTLSGACEEVNINGSKLKVAAGDGATLDIGTLNINGASNAVKTNILGAANLNGTANKVTYKKPKTGKRPKVASVGKGNAVTKVTK
jgi:hypothetical protein